MTATAAHCTGTVTTFRVDRPDGTATETVRDHDGRVTTARIAGDGTLIERVVAELSPRGQVTVSRHPGGEEVAVEVAPSFTSRATNPYGTTTEQDEFPDLLVVIRVFDDDQRLREVTMRGDWGDQVLEVRTDGSRTLEWSMAMHSGVQIWDAAGRPQRYEVDFSDGTAYHWVQGDDASRATVRGWDRETTVTEGAPAPVVQRPGN